MKFRLGAMAAAAALTTLAGQANAAVLSFDFTDNNPQGNNSSRTFTNGALQVTATGWSYETSGTTHTMVSAALGQWDKGLGVEYTLPGNNNDDGSHTVDNDDQIDFIYLEFTEAVNLYSANFNVFDINNGSNNTDGDAAAYYRTNGIADPTNNGNWVTFSGNWSGLIALNGNTDGLRYTGSSAYSTGWIISAHPSPTSGQNNYEDAFKLAGVTVNTKGGAVPEPATWAMMIGGFGAVGSMLRRRKMVVA